MTILGIETSCDECSAAVVRNGSEICSNVIASQIDQHRMYNGVVPEIASRLHTEWIVDTVSQALEEAGIRKEQLDGVAVTSRPGLIGSLIAGVNFAKSFAYALGIPFVGVDHIRAHLYAPHLERTIQYPYLGVLASGGHTLIARVNSFDDIQVLGTTIDDAIGEAFDKVAKHYNMGYPGGIAVDRLAASGSPEAFSFPVPSLHKGDHALDVSYSGLKTAVINQLDQFWDGVSEKTPENIAASFQKTAVDILVKRIRKALEMTGLNTAVVGGGVAANSRLRSELNQLERSRGGRTDGGIKNGTLKVLFPPPKLCTDNGAMIAGIGYHYLAQGVSDDLKLNASPRVKAFRRIYP